MFFSVTETDVSIVCSRANLARSRVGHIINTRTRSALRPPASEADCSGQHLNIKWPVLGDMLRA